MKTKSHHLLPTHIVPTPNQFVVMIVDDMPVNRVLLSKVLSGAGYSIVEAEDAETAVELIQSGYVKPDLIITDVEMPGTNGIELTRAIRELGGPVEQIPVIVASGNPDPDMEMDAYDAGADVFLVKPFNLNQLRREVADALRANRNIRVSVRRLRNKPRANELRTRLS